MPTAAAMPSRRDKATDVRVTKRKDGPGLMAPNVSAERMLNRERTGVIGTPPAGGEYGMGNANRRATAARGRYAGTESVVTWVPRSSRETAVYVKRTGYRFEMVRRIKMGPRLRGGIRCVKRAKARLDACGWLGRKG